MLSTMPEKYDGSDIRIKAAIYLSAFLAFTK
jgi:hypothetical protein